MNLTKPFNTNILKSNVVSMSPTNSLVNASGSTGVTVNSTISTKPQTVIIKTQNNNLISTNAAAANPSGPKPNQIFSIAKSKFFKLLMINCMLN